MAGAELCDGARSAPASHEALGGDHHLPYMKLARFNGKSSDGTGSICLRDSPKVVRTESLLQLHTRPSPGKLTKFLDRQDAEAMTGACDDARKRAASAALFVREAG